MKYAEMLVVFMLAKAVKIAEATGIKFGELYFAEEDTKELLALSEDKAKATYMWLKESVAVGYNGLNERVCPFCQIANFNCTECNYGKRHKECMEKGSDFDRITDKILETSFVSTTLPNEFYKKVIEELEKGGL